MFTENFRTHKMQIMQLQIHCFLLCNNNVQWTIKFFIVQSKNSYFSSILAIFDLGSSILYLSGYWKKNFSSLTRKQEEFQTIDGFNGRPNASSNSSQPSISIQTIPIKSKSESHQKTIIARNKCWLSFDLPLKSYRVASIANVFHVEKYYFVV